MHFRPILQLLENRQFEEDDHCCCSNFKYELFIKAGTRHVRTGPKKKNRIPEAHYEGAKIFVQLICRKWSCEPSTFRAKSLRAGEKNPHKLYIVRMLNACTLGWC